MLANGVRWAKFSGNTEVQGIGGCKHIKDPIETLDEKDYVEGVISNTPRIREALDAAL